MGAISGALHGARAGATAGAFFEGVGAIPGAIIGAVGGALMGGAEDKGGAQAAAAPAGRTAEFHTAATRPVMPTDHMR